MRLLPLLVLVIAIGCGSKQPAPTATTSPGPDTAEAAPSTPARTGQPDDPSCPPTEQQGAAVGTPCPTEGALCGHARVAAATGLSNIMSCTDGTWKNHEVPPPAPTP